MTITLYTATFPPLIRGLKNLSAILKKGIAHADEKGIPHEKLLSARLVDDMAAFPFQIQRVSDGAKGAAVRLTGIPPISMPDTETTFAQLQTRLEKTLEVVEKVKPEDVNGKEDMEVVLMGGTEKEIKFTAVQYVQTYVLPNFYFHVTTAYALLRHHGVPVGKMDYLLGGGGI